MRRPALCLTVLATLTLGVALACEAGDGGEEPAPPDTVETATGAEPAGAGETRTGVTPSGSSTASLTVSNPMPHAMTVRIEYAGGGGRRLGTVPANGEQTFTLAASPGETVTVVATDDEETHAPETSLDLAAGSNTWTIQ